MSYSFTVRASSKAEAKFKVAEAMAKVVEQQQSHVIDQKQAITNAEAFIGLLADDETKDVVVNMHGSIGWTGQLGVDAVITSAGDGISAALATREAAAA